jgi:hypothetical protein
MNSLIIQESDADTWRFILRITQLTNRQVGDVTKLTASRDSSVDIATRRRAERSGVRISVTARDVFLLQPPIQWVPGFFPGVKAEGLLGS